MANNKKTDFKQKFPGGFIWFLVAAFVMVLMVQNFIDTKFANVSFSYQLEHIVNLEFIQPEESRKTAINDNLATFSGKFREQLTEEGKNRYKYLELLNTNHELITKKEQVEEELESFEGNIHESADLFLHLSGTTIPRNGYVVYDDRATSVGQDKSIIIQSLSPKNLDSLPDLRSLYTIITKDPTEDKVAQFGSSLAELIRNFRSYRLGIGDEKLKQTLRQLDTEIAKLINSDSTIALRLAVYDNALGKLSDVVKELNRFEDHARLGKLRSVRYYNEAVTELSQLNQQLDDNLAQLNKARKSVSQVIWFFNNKEVSTKALERQDLEEYSHWFLNAKEEWEVFSANRGGIFKAPDQPLNLVLKKKFKSEEPTPNYTSYLITLLPILLIVFVLYFFFSRQMKGMGTNAMNFGKSPAKLFVKGENKVTFKDVAGIDEAIEELEEIVEFLKNPRKFTVLGGHIPKGVLCVGPPGTGKTLVARAVAGEADRPFFSISGSDFVEMFVGVGASRIRDMFEQAKKNAPCIVFIDEIDAVGRHRGAGIGGGHDEREQTLNQLLVEMDGFDINTGVIIIAATNRPDVLDKALLRPGRFDRRIILNLPDIKGRNDILKIHAKNIKMDPSVNLMNLARGTPGCSGADLENILNESALLAARRDKTAVTEKEISEARDKVLYGKERRSLELDEDEKRTTAYHEAGHTIVSKFVEHGDPVDKVTIIPRGFSLGATMFLPRKDRVSYWKKELIDQLAVLMGGRCAEEIFVHDMSSGAQKDFEQATRIARSMVCEWGMSEKLGTVVYDERSDHGHYLGLPNYHEKKYSEETAKAIDGEVRSILDQAHNSAIKIIKNRRKDVELMTQMLMEFETLDAEDIQKIVNNEWDIEEKRDRLKLQEELHKKKPATPPPPPVKDAKPKRPPEEPPPTPTLSHDIRA